MDVKTLRLRLARRYKAEVTCPITTGFHLRAVAEVALEKLKGGAKVSEITPFWRVLDEAAPTTARLSCGVAFVKKQRKAEGILSRHCEERSDEAIQRARSAHDYERVSRDERRALVWRACRRATGLLRRFAPRNDAFGVSFTVRRATEPTNMRRTMTDKTPITFADVSEAAQRIAGSVIRSPFVRSLTLSNITGADIWLKLESLQFTSSFKERGAANKLLTLPADERKRGVIAMSAGNHAQGLAYHAERLGIAGDHRHAEVDAVRKSVAHPPLMARACCSRGIRWPRRRRSRRRWRRRKS